MQVKNTIKFKNIKLNCNKCCINSCKDISVSINFNENDNINLKDKLIKNDMICMNNIIHVHNQQSLNETNNENINNK